MKKRLVSFLLILSISIVPVCNTAAHTENIQISEQTETSNLENEIEIDIDKEFSVNPDDCEDIKEENNLSRLQKFKNWVGKNWKYLVGATAVVVTGAIAIAKALNNKSNEENPQQNIDLNDEKNIVLQDDKLINKDVNIENNPVNNLFIDQKNINDENKNIINYSNSYQRYNYLEYNAAHKDLRDTIKQKQEQISNINVIDKRIFNVDEAYGIKNCTDEELNNMIDLLSSEDDSEVKEGLTLLKNMAAKHMDYMEKTYGKYISQLTPVDFIKCCKDNFYDDFHFVFTLGQAEKAFEGPLKKYGLLNEDDINDKKLLTSIRYFFHEHQRIASYIKVIITVVGSNCDANGTKDIIEYDQKNKKFVIKAKDEEIIKFGQDEIGYHIKSDKAGNESFMNENDIKEYMKTLEGLSKEDEDAYKNYLKQCYPGKDNVFRFGIC